MQGARGASRARAAALLLAAAVLLAGIAPGARADELRPAAALAEVLRAAFAGEGGADDLAGEPLVDDPVGAEPLRIVVVPPPPEATPLAPRAAARLLRRIAERAAGALDGRLVVAGDSAIVTAELDRAWAREGRDGWEKALARLGAGAGDLALSAEILPAGDALSLRLALVDLRNGRAIGPIPSAAVARPSRRAGDPSALMTRAFSQMIANVPEARDRLTIVPFATGTTGTVSRAGLYLAELARDAWLAAAMAGGRDLRDPTGLGPSVQLSGSDAAEGFRLEGRLWPFGGGIAQLRLALSDARGQRVSRRIDIDVTGLPPAIRATLAPGALRTPGGFNAVIAAGAAIGDAQLSMRTAGGPNPVYELCEHPAPATVRACGQLGLTLGANRSGHLLCFALGRDGQFNLLTPAAHYAAPFLAAGTSLQLPRDLPPPPGGGDVVWYAFGEPSAVLLKCALYETEGLMPLARLERFDGRRLGAAEVTDLAALLTAARPLASAYDIATITRIRR
ncbi:MAG: hypothetical protein AAF074_23750 [Pseudomonadota bacterium]